MSKKMLVIFLFASIMILATSFTGCQKEVSPPQHLTMRWGIPEEVRGFEGLQREPEGAEVGLVNRNTLKVEWYLAEKYVLPISATSEKEMEGVRYKGSGIPAHLEFEWLNPWEEQWYALEEIPEEMIRAEIKEEDGMLSIDFGPPEGADFEEGMTRVIWFRITPTELEEFAFNIYGYLPKEEDPSRERVSNTLTLEAEVKKR